MTDDALKVAEALDGQCMKSLEQVLEELGLEDTIELRRLIDMQAFCCDCCGWWCSTDELNNETDQDLCDECILSSDEED